MTRLEKRFVNRKKKAERNIEIICRCLEEVNVQAIRDVLELGCGIGVVSAFLADTYRKAKIPLQYQRFAIILSRP